MLVAGHGAGASQRRVAFTFDDIPGVHSGGCQARERHAAMRRGDDNLLNADHLDHLVAMVRGRGYKIVTTEEALRDPAYARQDAYVGQRGLSWLHRWALDAGKPAPDQPVAAQWLNVRD